MVKNLSTGLYALLLMTFLLAPAMFGQGTPGDGAGAMDGTTRTMLWMVPVSIALIFLIRRRRRKRTKAAE
ncbi:MAG: hypothetical protein KIT83_06970 [Bryobacterales bacterium]|nr:hypothetical protein [Bryobacterales bacterium]